MLELVVSCAGRLGAAPQGRAAPVAGHLAAAVGAQPRGVLRDERAQLAGRAADDLALEPAADRQAPPAVAARAKQVCGQRVRIGQLRARRWWSV